MRYKPKDLKSTIFIVVIIVVLVVAMRILAVGITKNATRVGFFLKNGWSEWSASYTMLDGYLQNTIHPKAETVDVQVETQEGTITIQIKDAEGNVIFKESNIATTSFEVEVPEKIVIRVDAENHKGSFSIE